MDVFLVPYLLELCEIAHYWIDCLAWPIHDFYFASLHPFSSFTTSSVDSWDSASHWDTFWLAPPYVLFPWIAGPLGSAWPQWVSLLLFPELLSWFHFASCRALAGWTNDRVVRPRPQSVKPSIKLLVLYSCVMQRRGFDPPLRRFFSRQRGGDFSLGVNMGSDSYSPKTLSDESINWGIVCAHMYSIVRTQRSWHSCPRRVNAGTKTHSTRTIHEDEMWLAKWLD